MPTTTVLVAHESVTPVSVAGGGGAVTVKDSGGNEVKVVPQGEETSPGGKPVLQSHVGKSGSVTRDNEGV